MENVNNLNYGATSITTKLDRSALNLDFLWLELTGKCNLHCIHCYAESSPYLPLTQTMTLRDWENIISEAYSLGCRKLQFIGGEATISPYLKPLLKYIRQFDFSFTELYTNGTVLSEELCTLIIESGTNVALSVYSSDPQIHDSITQKKGSWYKTISAIKNIIKLKIPIRVGIIVMDRNKEDLVKTKSFLKSIGVNNLSVDRIRGIGRGQVIIKNDYPKDELCGNCWKGKLCIASSGDIYPCVFSRFNKIGNYSDGLDKILSSDNLHNFRNELYQKSKGRLDSCDPEEIDEDDEDDELCGPEAQSVCGPDFDMEDDCSPMRIKD